MKLFSSRFWAISLVFLPFLILADEPKAPNLPSASEFLSLPTDRIFPYLEKMDKESAKELITQIRQTAKKDYSRIDNFYFVISHLENIRAIEEEQSRLKSLLWVYGLGFALFMGFLAWILFSLRRIESQMNRFQK